MKKQIWQDKRKVILHTVLNLRQKEAARKLLCLDTNLIKETFCFIGSISVYWTDIRNET